MDVVSDLKQKIYAATREGKLSGQRRSFCSATNIPLVGIKDIVSSVYDVKGVFDNERCALVWVENGLGDGLGVALTCPPGPDGWKDMSLTVGNKFSVSLNGGLTPEMMVRLALSELKFARESVVGLTLFADPDLKISPRLFLKDREFEQRVVALRNRAWPAIFPKRCYEVGIRPNRLHNAWAMAREIHRQTSPAYVVGCTLFGQKYFIYEPTRYVFTAGKDQLSAEWLDDAEIAGRA